MSSRVRLLFGRLGVSVLAILLAFVIWIVATLEADPFSSVDVPNVPLDVSGQPPNTVLLQQPPDTVTVGVRGPQSELRRLVASDFTATLDLSQVTPGASTTVPIEVQTNKSTIGIESVRPSQQPVTLEAVESITLPVRVALRGDVALGYQALEPEISPAEVRVSGPASALSTVAVITGVLGIDGAREPINAEVSIEARDAVGNLVPGVQWTPAHVGVSIGVRKRLGFKPDVTVIPMLRGEPASGYRRGGVTVEPSSVTLAGTPSVLDQLPGFVRTLPITITDATADLTVRTTLTVPQGITVVDVQFVTVTLQVLPIESSRIVTALIEVQGLAPGLVPTLSPNVLQVILAGPDTILSALKPGDVRVVLNLFEYTLGVHRVTPIVLAPEGVTTVSIIPETIEVVIDPAPVVSPTPSPTPD